MAFIGDAKRSLQPVCQKSNVGPGTYEVEKAQHFKASYAPFSSMQPKFCSKKQKEPQSKIGPGSYEVSKEIGNPSFTRIENEHSIIIKINDFGSSVFRSGQPRFSEGRGESTPGPGQCTLSLKVDLRPQNRSLSSHSNLKRRQNRSSQHPMIKNLRELNSSYEKVQELKSLVRPKLTAPKNAIGPGYYNPQNSSFQQQAYNAKGVRWDLCQQSRFKTETKEIMTPEHEQLITEQIRRQREKDQQRLPTTYFRSDTIRSHFDQIVYGTQSSIKADVRKKLGYKNPQPAPGSYLPVYDEPPPHSKYQFFGSTQERFKAESAIEVGPGDYVLPNGFAHKPKRKFKIDKTKRAPLEKTEEIPGPGAYDLLSQTFQKPSTNVEQFGSLQTRFKTSPAFQTAAPRHGLEDMITELHEKLEKREKPVKLCSPMFRSNTQRECFNNEREKINTPFAEYKIQQDDIGQKLKKKKNYLNHLAFCMLKRPAFDSSTGRFENPKKKRNEPLNISETRTRTPYQTYQRTSQSSVFQSKDSRKPFEIKKNAPPVGLYNQSPPQKKTTFNMRYSLKPKEGSTTPKRLKLK